MAARAPGETLRAEALVVGSGAGGAITAAMLATAGVDVLVAEEGPWIEQGTVEPFSIEQMETQYRNGGITAALGNPAIAYAEGRCVGGSTEINSGLYHSPPAHVIERWARDFEIRDLDPDGMSRISRAIEHQLSVGPLAVPATSISQRMVEGAAKLGWQAPEIPRVFRYDTAERDHHLAGQKQSMSRTYIPKGLDAGARIVPNCRVRRLHRRDGRFASATATLHRDGVTRPIGIDFDHLFLSAGAIQTAALLGRSDRRWWRGFPLRAHPTIKLAAAFDDDVNVVPDVAVHQVKEFGPDISFGGSVSRPGFVALTLADNWSANREWADDWRHIAVYYAAVRSEGHGMIRSVPGFDDPLVTHRLRPIDFDKLRWGLLKLAELSFAAGAQTVFPSITGATSATTLDEVRDLCLDLDPRRMSLMTIHLFSSLPMGELPGCPVDSFGRLKGFENAVVTDASTLPDAPGVNPQGTIMALAARNTEHFLASR